MSETAKLFAENRKSVSYQAVFIENPAKLKDCIPDGDVILGAAFQKGTYVPTLEIMTGTADQPKNIIAFPGLFEPERTAMVHQIEKHSKVEVCHAAIMELGL
jgi:hypothetical protein